MLPRTHSVHCVEGEVESATDRWSTCLPSSNLPEAKPNLPKLPHPIISGKALTTAPSPRPPLELPLPPPSPPPLSLQHSPSITLASPPSPFSYSTTSAAASASPSASPSTSPTIHFCWVSCCSSRSFLYLSQWSSIVIHCRSGPSCQMILSRTHHLPSLSVGYCA